MCDRIRYRISVYFLTNLQEECSREPASAHVSSYED